MTTSPSSMSPTSPDSYFTRQVELWGEQTQTELADKSIAIVGCGGLGCALGASLAGAGLKAIDLIDHDFVSHHNLHRQIAFTHNDVGKPKAECLRHSLENRALHTKIEAFPENFESYRSHNRTHDLILDATDNLPSRALIETFATEHTTPWVYTSVEEWHGQVCLFKHASFAQNLQITDRKPGGIAAPIVMLLAAFSANLALRYLTGDSVQIDVLHYLYFDTHGFQTQKFTIC